MSITADPRVARRYAEAEASQHRGDSGELTGDPGFKIGEVREYRIDLERLRFSPYFGRLSAVTQVMPQTGVGPVLHNRLTHTLKVSAVARVIGAQLAGRVAQHRAFTRGETATDDAEGAILDRLGGCDTIVVQAAAHAHDLGHPPFGHLGERVLDRVARGKLGLAEGFEGNAQTFRIITGLDTLGRNFPGLNLTAAVRASVLKYPWTRAEWEGIALADTPAQDRPRGAGVDPDGGAEKFSAYAIDAEEMEAVLAAHPGIASHRQTIECAVMDVADDIAYAVHDLDDYTRAGVLQQAAVSGELHGWLRDAAALAAEPEAALELNSRAPGRALELLWRRLHAKDRWIADRDIFHTAVARVAEELADDLLATPYDGGITSERAVSGFTRRWIERLRTSIVVEEHPSIRSAHVRLGRQAWHEVAVLKFVHARFVLERPDLAHAQRGQARVVEKLVLGFDAWLRDADDAVRAPRKLLEWEDETVDRLLERRREHHPDAPRSEAEARRQGRARAILDYVSSFTDAQAINSYEVMTQAGGR